MQNQNYRARTGGYRPASGSPQRRPSARPDPGPQRPRPGAQGQRPPGGSVRSPGGANRAPQRPGTGDVRRPAPQSAGARRPSPPPNANRPQQPSRRPAPRRAPKRKPRFSLSAFIVLAVVAVIAVYILRLYSIVGFGTPTFIDNVDVNGVRFAGMTREEGLAKAAEYEQEWLGTVYTFRYGDLTWDLTRSMMGAQVDYESALDQAWNLGHIGSVFERKRDIQMIAETPIQISLEPTYDVSLIDAFIAQISAAIDKEAVDAVVVADVDQPIVLTESQTGLSVNQDQLRDQIIALITTDEADTTIPVETVFPAINSDYASFQVIGQFSTDVSFRNRKSRTNVRIALSAFNGVSIEPGQSISFNEVVGERTEANGFQEATEYAGDVATLGIGGGVCQASTTLYNALVQAGMTITDRNQHTMTVSYVDPSLDAAVAWPKKDLQFKNETDYPIYIYTSVNNDDATVTIYGHRPEYYYQLESVIVEKNISSTKVNYIEDTEGRFVKYTDETYLESEGKPGCISEGWIVAYDWETKQEVSRTQISRDRYSPGASVYYVGTVDRAAELTAPSVSPAQAPQ